MNKIKDMENLLSLGSATLKQLATSETAKQYLLEHRPLYSIVKRAADRYIGGETLEETIGKVMAQNKRGVKCSIEFMGENTRTAEEAEAVKNEFLRVCRVIGERELNATVALDLSHIGLAVSEELCLGHLLDICYAAERDHIEVNISAEGPDRTDAILRIYQQASRITGTLAITLQAYLYRTREDFEQVKSLPGRIRIVKGAYGTLPGVSMPRGAVLNDAYLGYVDQLLASKHACAIATHDEFIQAEAKKLIGERQAENDDYEFESLYGIATAQLNRLAEEGYPTKQYFVYGTDWHLYLCNRLSEFPLNIFQALADMLSFKS